MFVVVFGKLSRICTNFDCIDSIFPIVLFVRIRVSLPNKILGIAAAFYAVIPNLILSYLPLESLLHAHMNVFAVLTVHFSQLFLVLKIVPYVFIPRYLLSITLLGSLLSFYPVSL